MDGFNTQLTENSDSIEVFDTIKQLVYMKSVEDDKIYAKLNELQKNNKSRLIIPLSYFSNITNNFASKLITDPYGYFPPIQQAFVDIAQNILSHKNSTTLTNYSNKSSLKIGISGWFGSRSVTPRGIKSSFVNQMILVEGIVTRCSNVNARLLNAAFYIPDLDRHFFRQQEDNIAIVPKLEKPIGPAYNLNKDVDGHVIEIEYGLSNYKNIQIITLQEMPEITPTGQLPRSVDVVLEDDLVDKIKPGDRCRVSGVLRSNIKKSTSFINGYSRTYLIANYVDLVIRTSLCLEIRESTLKCFQELANLPNTLEIIGNSICPSICGHERVRQGLALQLVGGLRKVVTNDLTTLRGDIHILLLGDPSCGKSQMLRFVLKLAPLSISTTGRGTTAVGLTAAVVTDTDTGQRRLEAGAMVLADGGLVAIDEFDKMSNEDRVVVHEVMEQQSVSINKAGITATLNARTSVLALANPIQGSFDDNLDFVKQINFPDSLLSRFDLIFIIREANSSAIDRRIAAQVLSQLRVPQDEDFLTQLNRERAMRADKITHTIVQPKLKDHDSSNQDELDNIDKQKLQIWNSKWKLEGITNVNQEKTLKIEFLRAYLDHCRFKFEPVITEEVSDAIAKFYIAFRKKIYQMNESQKERHPNANHSIPTPRFLEATIRLSTAHAKLKMRSEITMDDFEKAKSLLLYTMLGVDKFDDDLVEQENENNDLTNTKRFRVDDFDDYLALSDYPVSESAKKMKKIFETPLKYVDVEPDADVIVYKLLKDLEQEHEEDTWDYDYIVKKLKKKHSSYSDNMISQIMKNLQISNKVMIANNRIYLV